MAATQPPKTLVEPILSRASGASMVRGGSTGNVSKTTLQLTCRRCRPNSNQVGMLGMGKEQSPDIDKSCFVKGPHDLLCEPAIVVNQNW